MSKSDMVAYDRDEGSNVGRIDVFKNKKFKHYTPNVFSGNSGSTESEKGRGPIPNGLYSIHPRERNKPVENKQKGVCGARSIPKGYQEIILKEAKKCWVGTE